MATLADRIRAITDLDPPQAEHLRALCSSWQVLADLSFSDLLLYIQRRGEETFEVCAQLRPFTSQTLYPRDMVGTKVTQPEQPIVERAWREGKIWAQDDPVLVDGIPIRMDAVPVRHHGRIIAVLTKEGSPATSRRPGRLEQVYLRAADSVSEMIAEGTFPWPHSPAGEWPRVGDGLFLLDEDGKVTWASPNAVSHLRRLGFTQNILGRFLDELGLGGTPVRLALNTQALVDGELSRGDTVVILRVMPLIERGRTIGGLALARDVTEIREKERVISVKDTTIREIHHRVKNNLQTIASLLRLQTRRLSSDEAKDALRESVLRIGSIALVHETLSEDPSDVAEFGEVARRIGQMVAEGLILPEREIEIKVTGNAGPVGADLATPLAVTLTELIQNSIEHRFGDGRSGTVAVEIARERDEIVLVVRDDGAGFKDDALFGGRLGLQIVRSLIDELGGRFEIQSEGGTRVEVRVPTQR
ncbi:MAG TPA: histidine kinase N-terminal domain-containing protein [Actinomycetota bacterium]|nr:histidine kinase N-terminal domain-containing protein [Actinomycetota bacterium]